jgi:DNA-binding XRE family transcriptional regulator
VRTGRFFCAPGEIHDALGCPWVHGQRYDPVVTAARVRRAQIVGRNIRLARLAAGLSQRELAELVGCHRHQLSDWERGLHEPSVGNLDRVVAVLGYGASWFFWERSA